MENHKIYSMTFGSVYPLYVAKAEKKGRTREEIDIIINWLTGYTTENLEEIINSDINFSSFFEQAPNMNPKRNLIKGSVCGVKVQEIEEDIMREIRYLDKLVDELAMGKSMEKILRK